jgi:hypothetical protein
MQRTVINSNVEEREELARVYAEKKDPCRRKNPVEFRQHGG